MDYHAHETMHWERQAHTCTEVEGDGDTMENAEKGKELQRERS
jgi:hypothetical protein